MSSISKISERAAEAIYTDLEGWKKISGTPSMTTWIEYTSPDGKTIAGSWQANPGTYHATYTSWEYVHLIEGEIIITPDGGTATTVKAGDSFVVEADFSGTWEIIKPVYKHFTIQLS